MKRDEEGLSATLSVWLQAGGRIERKEDFMVSSTTHVIRLQPRIPPISNRFHYL